jgi:hypothetical protein
VTYRWLFPLAAAVALTASGCAGMSAAGGAAGVGPRTYLTYDDGRAEGVISFPNATFESLMRFEMPPGEHRVQRLWFQAAGPGTFEVTLYETGPLDGVGTAVHRLKQDVAKDWISEGRDGRWIVVDVSNAPSRKGAIYIGFKRAAGTAALWATPLDSGQYFIRNEDPQNHIEMLPVRRTPLVRLELAP